MVDHHVRLAVVGRKWEVMGRGKECKYSLCLPVSTDPAILTRIRDG